MKITDYLLMKPKDGASERMSINASEGKVSSKRILLSFVGILLGIFLSFIVTGIETNDVQNTDPNTTEITISKENNVKVVFPKPDELLAIGIITLVICGLTYQSLYLNLKLYINEPTFLTIFVSFQYGFFWQAMIKTGSAFI